MVLLFVFVVVLLPPPTPATTATASSVPKETPGLITIAASTAGTSSRVALMTVQLRPPNRATAKVYGSRSTAPSAVGTVVSTNLPAGSMWYSGPRNSTSTDHRLQTEKPMCSEKMEKTRLRRATRAPFSSQNAWSSGRQSLIQRLRASALGRCWSTAGMVPPPGFASGQDGRNPEFPAHVVRDSTALHSAHVPGGRVVSPVDHHRVTPPVNRL